MCNRAKLRWSFLAFFVICGCTAVFLAFSPVQVVLDVAQGTWSSDDNASTDHQHREEESRSIILDSILQPLQSHGTSLTAEAKQERQPTLEPKATTASSEGSISTTPAAKPICNLQVVKEYMGAGTVRLQEYLNLVYGHFSEKFWRTWDWAKVDVIWFRYLPHELQLMCETLPKWRPRQGSLFRYDEFLWVYHHSGGACRNLKNNGGTRAVPVIAAGQWVEVAHSFFYGRPQENMGFWAYRAIGSGIWFYTGLSMIAVDVIDVANLTGLELYPKDQFIERMVRMVNDTVATVEFTDHADVGLVGGKKWQPEYKFWLHPQVCPESKSIVKPFWYEILGLDRDAQSYACPPLPERLKAGWHPKRLEACTCVHAMPKHMEALRCLHEATPHAVLKGSDLPAEGHATLVGTQRKRHILGEATFENGRVSWREIKDK